MPLLEGARGEKDFSGKVRQVIGRFNCCLLKFAYWEILG